MQGWGLIVTIIIIVSLVTVGHAWWWPLQRCPACLGRGGRGALSTPAAYNRCRRCKGTGERVRPLTRVLHQTTGLPIRQPKK